MMMMRTTKGQLTIDGWNQITFVVTKRIKEM
jgi:hypothetical protein